MKMRIVILHIVEVGSWKKKRGVHTFKLLLLKYGPDVSLRRPYTNIKAHIH